MLIDHLPPSVQQLESEKGLSSNSNYDEIRYHSAPYVQDKIQYSNYQVKDRQIKIAHEEFMEESKKQIKSPSYEELDALQLQRQHKFPVEIERAGSSWTYRAGGGGAPVTDAFGNILTTRRSLITNQVGDMKFRENARKKENNYREELLKQIEERKKREAIIKERERWEAEQEAKRIEQQRLHMVKEYEEELVRKRQKEEQMRLRMNQLNEMQEKARKEEKKRQQEEALRREEMRKVKEAQNDQDISTKKSLSPPIPAIRSEILMSQTKPNSSSEPGEKPKSAMSELSQLRKHVIADHLKKMEELKKQQPSYKVTSRRVLEDDSDDDENV